MEQYIEIITINLIPGGMKSACHAKQYDKGRVIRANLVNGLTPYSIKSGDVFTLNVKKPDGNIVTVEVEATEGNTYVDFSTTEQMCAVAGKNNCEFSIENGSDLIGTANFFMIVEESPLEGGIQSQSEINNLNRQIDDHLDEVLPEKIAEKVPQAVDDYIGDNYYDKEQADEKFATNDVLNKFPSDVLWSDNVLAGKLKRTFNGITTDFDVASLKPEQGKTYYIRPNGSDSNSGEDRDHPLQKLSTAVAKSDVQTIVVMDGIYNLGRVGGSFTKGINIVADTEAHPIFIMSRDKTWSKTNDYDYIYETTDTASAFYGVIKADTRDADGDLLSYTLVGSLADVEATENSYYVSDHTIYIHSESAPQKVYVLVSGVNIHATLGDNAVLYIEGIEFVGGNYGGVRVTNSGTAKPTVLVKNCGFSHSYLGNAFYLQGCSGVVQNCYASYSSADGFNYHANGGVIPDTVEINCIGRHNGTVGNNTNNGSTTHDGAKILRLNCEFYDNIGPNLADVNNSLSFNYGVVSHDSAGASTNKTGFQCQGGSMYNDTCSAYNNDYNFQAYLGGTLYQHNCSGSVDTGADGKAKAY